MIIAENDNSLIYEEPSIYHSNTSNFGVKAIFSERKIKPIVKYLPVNPSTPHNTKFSLCNTIMQPTIKVETSLDPSISNYNNANPNNKKLGTNEKNSSLKKDITRDKTESSKEEKNINEEKYLTRLLIETKKKQSYNNIIEKKLHSINFEKNPFFLGKPLSLSQYQNNIIPKKNDLNNENKDKSDEKNNENEIKNFFRKGPSKSVCSEKQKKNNHKEDDDKSDNIVKKRKNLSIIKKDFLNFKFENKKEKEKTIKEKLLKRKINLAAKNSKKENEKNKIKDECLKMKKEKLKIDKNKRCKSYFSNKCVTNYYNFELISKKIKNGNNNNNNNKNDNNKNENNNNEDFESQKTEKKSKKKSKFNRLKTQRIEGNINKTKGIKNIKDEIKEVHNSKGSTKELNHFKENFKIKEKDFDNPKDKSLIIEKKQSEAKTKRFKSKNEIINMKISKEIEKEIKKREKTVKRKFSEKIDKYNVTPQNKNEKTNEEEKSNKEKTKVFSNKKIGKEKNNDADNSEQINKCLTVNLTRKKSFGLVDKNIKNKNTYTSFKKKSQDLLGINLFGKTKNKKKIDFESALKNNLKKTQFNLFSKDKFTNTEFTDCDYLKYTLDCMELILEIDIEKQTRLKNKINFNFPKPKKSKIKKKIALFDLDETLVHCTGDLKINKDKYQHAIEIKLPGKQAVTVGINLRPYWKQTLNLIKKYYYIVIYTASHQAYADAVLDFMDPKKKYFKYRLFRNNCSLVDVDGAKFYVKDLDIFNEYYDLKDIIIVDNSVLSFAFHLHNGIPIVPFYDEDKEGSLYVVGLYLMHIFNEEDLREANKKQINLDSFLEEAKKQKEEEYMDIEQIDEESYSKEEENNDNNNDKSFSEINKKYSKKSLDEKSEKDKIRLSEKRVTDKKSSKFGLKDQNNDLTQKKLMSQSKLINMYYEFKDKSKNNEELIESNKELLKSEKKDSKNSLINKGEKDKNIDIIFYDNDDCKSDPGHFHSENKIDENEEPILKRVSTIIIDEDYTLKNNLKDENMENNSVKSYKSSKIKLGFIRSNFYKNFKI